MIRRATCIRAEQRSLIIRYLHHITEAKQIASYLAMSGIFSLFYLLVFRFFSFLLFHHEILITFSLLSFSLFISLQSTSLPLSLYLSSISLSLFPTFLYFPLSLSFFASCLTTWGVVWGRYKLKFESFFFFYKRNSTTRSLRFFDFRIVLYEMIVPFFLVFFFPPFLPRKKVT